MVGKSIEKRQIGSRGGVYWYNDFLKKLLNLFTSKFSNLLSRLFTMKSKFQYKSNVQKQVFFFKLANVFSIWSFCNFHCYLFLFLSYPDFLNHCRENPFWVLCFALVVFHCCYSYSKTAQWKREVFQKG